MFIDILTCLAVCGIVGLLASVLLVLASHFFSVKVDDRVLKIRACLPGANCGACGYTGCDGYAKALVDDGAKTNLCIPGALAVAESISEILGVEVEEVENVEVSVAVVHCNGNCDAAPRKAIYDGITSCAAANSLFGGPDACTFGCLGCGDCAAACPMEAICIRDGIAHVDSRVCIGCGLCINTCPKGIISLMPRSTKTVVLCSNTEKGAVARKNCKNACIGCRRCELDCAEEAITVVDNLARIDNNKCTGCAVCVEKCPTKALASVDFRANEE